MESLKSRPYMKYLPYGIGAERQLSALKRAAPRGQRWRYYSLPKVMDKLNISHIDVVKASSSTKADKLCFTRALRCLCQIRHIFVKHCYSCALLFVQVDCDRCEERMIPEWYEVFGDKAPATQILIQVHQ